MGASSRLRACYEVVDVLLRTLVVMSDQLGNCLLTSGMNVTCLRTQRRIVMTAQVDRLNAGARVRSVLLSVVSNLDSNEGMVLRTVLAQVDVFCVARRRPIVFCGVAYLYLGARIRILATVVARVRAHRQHTTVLLSAFGLDVDPRACRGDYYYRGWFFRAWRFCILLLLVFVFYLCRTGGRADTAAEAVALPMWTANSLGTETVNREDEGMRRAAIVDGTNAEIVVGNFLHYAECAIGIRDIGATDI